MVALKALAKARLSQNSTPQPKGPRPIQSDTQGQADGRS